MNGKKITVNSSKPDDTIALGEKIGQCCKGGEIMILCGTLGAGKTCLVKGIVKGLNIKETITSPTFVLHAEYHGRVVLNHIDAYRLDGTKLDTSALGFSDFLGKSHSVTVIEWPEFMIDEIPQGYIKIEFEMIKPTSDRKTSNKRTILLSATDKRHETLLEQIE